MEEIKKIEVQGQQYGVADLLLRSVMGGHAQVVEWSHTHNMNDYKEAGTYRIKGERTGNIMTDNLPIMNSGSGNSIDGVLMVMDSTLSDENTDDNFNVCITQFLMLSNRVGGQEGDMYMRSGYGNTKDNLTWKAWEKYQTNMEVGCVSDYMLINPQDWTRIGDVGMLSFMDNGIYSGIYIPQKAVLGTPDMGGVVDKDDNAIETFVMIVINNYLAAGDAKCVTQIKFSVTNGGVFSMEKRNSHIGADTFDSYTSWTAWESVGGGTGGGLPNYVSFEEQGSSKYYFGCKEPESIAIGSGVAIGQGVRIEKGITITKESVMGGNGLPAGVSISIPKENNGFIIESKISTLSVGSGIVTIKGPGVETHIYGNSSLGNNVTIGASSAPNNTVHIDNGIWITNSSSSKSELVIGGSDAQTGGSDSITLGRFSKIGAEVVIDSTIKITCNPDNSDEGIAIGTSISRDECTLIGRQTRIGDYVCIGTTNNAIVDAFMIYGNGDKIVFSYNGKTAELQLT